MRIPIKSPVRSVGVNEDGAAPVVFVADTPGLDGKRKLPTPFA